MFPSQLELPPPPRLARPGWVGPLPSAGRRTKTAEAAVFPLRKNGRKMSLLEATSRTSSKK